MFDFLFSENRYLFLQDPNGQYTQSSGLEGVPFFENPDTQDGDEVQGVARDQSTKFADVLEYLDTGKSPKKVVLPPSIAKLKKEADRKRVAENIRRALQEATRHLQSIIQKSPNINDMYFHEFGGGAGSTQVAESTPGDPSAGMMYDPILAMHPLARRYFAEAMVHEPLHAYEGIIDDRFVYALTTEIYGTETQTAKYKSEVANLGKMSHFFGQGNRRKGVLEMSKYYENNLQSKLYHDWMLIYVINNGFSLEQFQAAWDVAEAKPNPKIEAVLDQAQEIFDGAFPELDKNWSTSLEGSHDYVPVEEAGDVSHPGSHGSQTLH